MALETPVYVADFVTTNPTIGDARSEGDDHIRNIKIALQNTFPGMAGRAWRRVVKSGAANFTFNDNFSVFDCTAAITVSADAVAAIGNGWVGAIYADGFDVTFDPNGGELVNGAVTLAVPNGFLALIWSTGVAFIATLMAVSSQPATLAGTQTLTNKTLTTPIVSNPDNLSQVLVDAVNIDWNMNLGGKAQVTLAGNRIFNAPTNFKRATYALHILQDATGGRTLTWNAIFKWPNATPPVLSTGAGKRDVLFFDCDGVNFYGPPAPWIDVR